MNCINVTVSPSSAIDVVVSPLSNTAVFGGIGNYPTGVYVFSTNASSGVNSQFISFPTNLGNNPFVFCSLYNSGNNEQIFAQPSQITSSGYLVEYLDTINSNNYILNTLACIYNLSGLAVSVVNNYYSGSGGGGGNGNSNIEINGSSSLATANFTGVSGINLFLSGDGQTVFIDGGIFVKNSNTGNFITNGETGILSNSFYPLNSNPANYVTSASAGGVSSLTITGYSISGVIVISGYSGVQITTGSATQILIGFNNNLFVSPSVTGNFITNGQTGLLSNSFYPLNTNPSSFVSSSQTGNFLTNGTTGVLTNLFVENTQTGGFIDSAKSGLLTGTFYPLNGNPSNFVTSLQTGNFITNGMTGALTNLFIENTQTGNFITNGQTGVLSNSFYPLNSNPSGYITVTENFSQSGAYVFQTVVNSGVTSQFISFPASLGGTPTILTTLDSPYNGTIIAQQTSGVVSNGFWVIFSDQIDTTGYTLHTLASISTGTGLATNIIINNNYYSGTANFTGASGVNLFYSGNSLIIIDGGAFVTTVQTGNFITNGQTGILSNSFYPLNSNPSNYINSNQTGVFVSTGNTGAFVTIYQTGQLTGAFYPLLANPSNYVVSSQTGNFITNGETGILSNSFYPLNSNPANYLTSVTSGVVISLNITGYNISGAIVVSGYSGVQVITGSSTEILIGFNNNLFVAPSATGNFITNGMTGTLVGTGQTGVLSNAFYSSSNPSGYISIFNQTNIQSGAYIFNATVTSGVTQQFITFPTTLGSNPYIMPFNLISTVTNESFLVWPSGISSSGYWAQYSFPIDNSGYVLTTFAALSTSTGIATTLITQNYVTNVSGTYVQITGSAFLTGINFTGVSGINLFLSGNNQVIFDGGAFVLNNITGNFITNGMTGGFVSSGNTGAFVTIYQTGNFLTSVTGIQEFSTPITTGFSSQFISFNFNFSSIPRVFTTVEISGSNMYLCNISGRTVSGYTAMFSDIVYENGVILHTYASIQ